MFENLRDLLFELGLAALFLFQRIQVGLERDLLRGMFELSIAEPHPMAVAPGLSFKPQVAAQQKGLDTDARAPDILASSMARSRQVSKCLMKRVGHPDVGKFASTMKPCERDRVPSIVLDPVPRLLRC